MDFTPTYRIYQSHQPEIFSSIILNSNLRERSWLLRAISNAIIFNIVFILFWFKDYFISFFSYTLIYEKYFTPPSFFKKPAPHKRGRVKKKTVMKQRSQSRIRTCDIATFITSRVQELMDRGVFRMWSPLSHYAIPDYFTTYSLTLLFRGRPAYLQIRVFQGYRPCFA